MKKDVTVYTRVANEAGSNEDQKKEIVQFIEENGMRIERMYEVHGTSSHGEQILADALSHMVHTGINKMVTLEPSRISRNPLDVLKIENEFIDQGKEIVYVRKRSVQEPVLLDIIKQQHKILKG